MNENTKKRFKRIYIEITNLCNLQCSFCPEVSKPKFTMTPENFEKMIQQIAPLCEEITLHLLGEPLAHPQFLQILSICHQHQVFVNLTTNGLLLPRYQEIFLSSDAGKSLRQINFSLQSFEDNFPNKDIKDYLSMLWNFVLLASKHREDLYINWRLWDVEPSKISPLREQVFHFLDQKMQTTHNPNVDVGHRKSKKIKGRFYLHFDSRFVWPSLDLPILGQDGKCHGLGHHIGIHSDGSVVPCCLDQKADLLLGNCLQDPLAEIIENEKSKKIIAGFASGQLTEDLCQRCPYIQRFKK